MVPMHLHWFLFIPSSYLAVTVNVEMLFFAFTIPVRALVQYKGFLISDLTLKVI